jgi:elongation factor P
MLGITDLKVGTKITLGDEPYVILSYSQSKMGRGGSIVKVKIKNLKNGSTLDKTFQGAEKIDTAVIEKSGATYLYKDENDAHFMDSNSFDQFKIPLSQLGEQKDYLVEGSAIDILYFENRPINIDMPVKMNFKVISAPPSVKGNSQGSVTKDVTIETGAKVATPIFINENDTIVVDTRTGTYVERG